MGVIKVSKHEMLLKPNVRFSKMHPSGMSMRCPSFAITRNIRCGQRKWKTHKQPTDDGTTQSDVPTKVDISCHSQMVKVDNMWYLLESLVELLDLTISFKKVMLSWFYKNGYLLEMTAKFDRGQSGEHAILIHNKTTIYKHKKITFHK